MRAWVRGAAVGLVGLLALFVAAGADGGFWHYAGFLIAGLAVLVIFRLIARAHDAPGERTPLVPVPADEGARYRLGGAAVLLGLIGLFIAAGSQGGAGSFVGFTITGLAWAYVFRLIGAAFGDR